MCRKTAPLHEGHDIGWWQIRLAVRAASAEKRAPAKDHRTAMPRVSDGSKIVVMRRALRSLAISAKR